MRVPTQRPASGTAFGADAEANERRVQPRSGQQRNLGIKLVALMRFLVIVFAVAVVAGCKSRPLGPYVSPRVVGRVVAAQSGLPLAGVKVTRGSGNRETSTGALVKGGELLMRKSPVQTNNDGRFFLVSERVLSVFRGAGWNCVSLTFDGMGYQQFRTNCSISLASTPTNGPPVLDVGTVYMQPISPSR